MYSAGSLIKISKTPTKLTGTHQKINRIARNCLAKHLDHQTYFPTTKEILYFEGARGPDSLKHKSPGIDEPAHFILPDQDDGKLITIIKNHQHNLRTALKNHNRERAAFEAAWLAHAVVDGLTPAHHFPYQEAVQELMTKQEFVKVFSQPIKGIMRGRSALETARNNWLYWGAQGYMNKHLAFEYGVAVVVTATPDRTLTPKLTRTDLDQPNLEKEFYQALNKIHHLNMYGRFRQEGWTTKLALETKKILIPTIIRTVACAFASALPPKEASTLPPKEIKWKLNHPAQSPPSAF